MVFPPGISSSSRHASSRVLAGRASRGALPSSATSACPSACPSLGLACKSTSLRDQLRDSSFTVSRSSDGLADAMPSLSPSRPVSFIDWPRFVAPDVDGSCCGWVSLELTREIRVSADGGRFPKSPCMRAPAHDAAHPQRSVHAARATLRVALSWLKREAKILTCGDWASGTTHFGFVPIVISGCPRCMTAAFRLVTCPRFGRAGGKWAFLGFFTRWLRDARRRRTRAGSTCAGRCGPRGPVMEQVDNHTLPHSAARGRRACSAFPLPAACKCHAACVHRAPSSKNEIPTRRSSPRHQVRALRPRLTSPARVSPVPPASVDSGQRGGSVVVLNFRVSNERKLQRSLASPPPYGLGSWGTAPTAGFSGNGGDGARRGAGHAAANGTRCEPARATWCYHGGEPEFWGTGHGAGRRYARGVLARVFGTFRAGRLHACTH